MSFGRQTGALIGCAILLATAAYAANVSASDELHEMRLDPASMRWTSHIETTRTDLSAMVPDPKAQIVFATVTFKSEKTPLRLPAKMTIDSGTLHQIHRYSDYRMTGSNEPGRAVPASDIKGEDAVELLVRAAELTTSQPGEAVRLLQQSIRLEPDRGATRYQAGIAYLATGDLADAETELREAAAHLPDSAPVRDSLNLVLGREQTGARTPETTPSENTIKVDVRQVLVPVVVTDHEGHHVTGLTQADFRVLEDGVEQKITAFSVETSGLSQEAGSTPNTPHSQPAAAPQITLGHAAVRRTYVICIDTLHSAFNNFEWARKALVKLFEQERSADSQYVVVALGVSSEMVLNVTPDPTAVLAALQGRKFHKIFLDGQMGSTTPDMQRYRRDLNETRAACDLAGTDKLFQIKCEAGMARSYQEAAQIAELDRTLTVGFLRQFRNLVAQLSKARDRRTIVLLSDGFQITPGREAYDLLNAFFPSASHCLVPPDVNCPQNMMHGLERMQDEFEPILRLAAKSNVTVDTIDSRGLYGQAAFDASNAGNSVAIDGSVGRVERNVAADDGNTLMEIADATGGTAFHDNNNLFAGLQRAFADGREYYTIAYTSTNSNLDGKFRAITVHVPNRKVIVNAKRGYWAAAQ